MTPGPPLDPAMKQFGGGGGGGGGGRGQEEREEENVFNPGTFTSLTVCVTT